MEIELLRYNGEDDYTAGLFVINGKHICFSLEDEIRTVKKWGETCIPTGRFPVVARAEGSMHKRYQTKFGEEWHPFMLCISNKDGYRLEANNLSFQYILIHIGNDDDDTAGCPLTGSVAYADKGRVDRSTDAYKKFYPIVRDALLAGEEVWITIEQISK